MVDAHVSGACGAIREGSSPSFDIKLFRAFMNRLYFGNKVIFIGFY